MNRTSTICYLAAIITLLGMRTLEAAEHTKDALTTVKKNIEDKKAVLLDVREKTEWDAGHVKNALLCPLSELSAETDAKKIISVVPKNKIVYAHCAKGGRCLFAADILKKHGYDVRPLKPGYQDLIDAGFEKAEKK